MSCDADAFWATVVALLILGLCMPRLPGHLVARPKKPPPRVKRSVPKYYDYECRDPFFGYYKYKERMDRAAFFKDAYGVEAAWKDWSWAAKSSPAVRRLADDARNNAIRQMQKAAETTDENG